MRWLRRDIARVPADCFGFWRRLHPHPRHGFFLGAESAQTSRSALYFSVEEPVRLIETRDPRKDALAGIDSALKADRSRCPAPRFVGMLGFEAGWAFDPGLGRLPTRPDTLGGPVGLFGDYRSVVRVDLRKGVTTLWSRSPRAHWDRLAGRFMAHFRETGPDRGQETPASRAKVPGRPQPEGGARFRRRYFGQVLKAKAAIARGDIYQANLSLRFSERFDGDPARLYRFLCRANPSPYAALLKQGDRWIVSCSPELLLRVERRRVATRPIAGTRPRGSSTAMDRRRQGQLLLSPKERAEHVMLVDLERNDLGRICKSGSVKLADAYAVERYSHVMHIVSEVRGRLEKGKTSRDALRALFPGGTITGCPKIRSVEMIQEIEGVRRGPFYGSAGFFSANGDAVFNILIRTALVHGGRVVWQAGAGIVADSRPSNEYREILAKGAAIAEAVRAVKDAP
jgi:anthranilate/para-aminobenzoate synthase component I